MCAVSMPRDGTHGVLPPQAEFRASTLSLPDSAPSQASLVWVPSSSFRGLVFRAPSRPALWGILLVWRCAILGTCAYRGVYQGAFRKCTFCELEFSGEMSASQKCHLRFAIGYMFGLPYLFFVGGKVQIANARFVKWPAPPCLVFACWERA